MVGHKERTVADILLNLLSVAMILQLDTLGGLATHDQKNRVDDEKINKWQKPTSMIGADGVVFVHFIHVDGFTSFHVITSLCSRKWFTSFTKLIRFAHVRFSHFRTTGAIFVEDYLRRQWRPLFVPLALFFVGHDVEDEVVGDFHAIVTDASEVADSAVDIVLHDAFGGVGIGVLHS